MSIKAGDKRSLLHLSRESRHVFLIYVAAVVLIFLSRFISASFGSWHEISTILSLSVFLVAVGFGQGIVVLLGELDLSISSLITLAGVLTTTWVNSGGDPVMGIVKILVVVSIIGAINGIGVAVVGIPSFIMTLATQIIVYGATLGFTGGTALGLSPKFLDQLMGGQLIGIPVPVWLVLAFAIIGWLVLRLTTFGRKIYCVGSNRTAAFIAGLPVKRLIILAFSISGFSAAVTGMLLVGYSSGAVLTMGDPYLLPSIAAVVIGGTAITGGRGSYLGTVGAAILLTTVSTLVTALGISAGWQTFLYGLIIFAVLFFLRQTSFRLTKRPRLLQPDGALNIPSIQSARSVNNEDA